MGISRFIVCGALLIGVARSTSAQIVRGSVTDSITRQPVADFIVVLLDANGQTARATTAGAAGEFAFTAPRAGQYRLRLQRIGYRNTTTEPFDVKTGETVVRRLAIASISVALDAVRVSGHQECVIRPEEGAATALVWNEARKALFATQLSQSGRLARLTVRDFSRDFDADYQHVRADSSVERSGVSDAPYQSLESGALAKKGYVQQDEDGSSQQTSAWFYAPDANVLMSDDFAATHCLHLLPDGAAGRMNHDGPADLIALAFEPVKSRSVSDIRGVLWIDRHSAGLRSLDFQYTDLQLPQGALPDSLFGGRVDFQAMPGGAWIVRKWLVRAPMVQTIEKPKISVVPKGPGRPGGMTMIMLRVRELVSVREQGGEVMSATSANGTPLWATSLGSAQGVVVDGATKRPAPAVPVSLRGTAHSTVTDGAGRYRLDSLAPGDYTIMLARSLGDSAAALPIRSLAVRAKETTKLDLELPSLEKAAVAKCVDLRATSERAINTSLAAPAALPALMGPDSASRADLFQKAQAVVQVVLDTLGHPDMATYRPIRSQSQTMLEIARRQISHQEFPPAEAAPGCKIRQIIAVPFNLRPGN